MQRLLRITFTMVTVATCLANLGLAQEAGSQHEKDAAAIKAAVQSYAEAFNARDARKLADHWAPEGVYINRSTGDIVRGRAAMVKEFEAMFAAESAPRLAVETTSIDFISPNVALERGTATVIGPGDSEYVTNYKVVFVQQGGKWLVDRVTEEEAVVEISNYDKLKELEWIIGNWVDEGDGITISTECNWTRNNNFISRKYAVTTEEGAEHSGLQIIGWDAKAGQIRSWLFDSSGGFIEGTWSQRDDRWVVQSVATFADGVSGSFTSIFRPLEDGRYAWRKINRVIDGELLPNIDEVIVTRN